MIAAKFSVWTFTDSEVNQVCELFRSICAGALKFDLRKLSKNVRDYAFRWGLLERDEKGQVVPKSYIGWRDLPIEAVWRIIRPAFGTENSKGRSIAKSQVWYDLNIFPDGSRHHSANDLEEITECLIRLQSYGYVWAQFGGSVWEITINNQAK